MKLVDILARELEVWPEMPEGGTRLEQDNNNAVIEGDSFGTRDLFMLSERCEDFQSAPHVTRAQWQAAVDALKDDEVVYSAENVSLNENYATHTNSPVNAECKIVQFEWTGEGLPPVGTVCEAFHPARETWLSVKIIDRQIGSECCACRDDQDYLWWSTKFRPIRTPEQIAAEEMARGVREMRQVMAEAGGGIDAELEALWLAGYRKF